MINMACEMMNILQVFKRSSELAAIVDSSPDSLPEVMQFDKLRKANGLKVALDWNAARFAEENAWWKVMKKT
jgi:hypothetical protein